MTDFLVERTKTVEAVASLENLLSLQLTALCGILDLTKQAAFTPVDAVVFDDDPTTYTSSPISCTSYRKFLLRLRLTVTGAPTSIQVFVQFSQGSITYENYTRGPFNSLMYEYSAGAKNECIEGEVLSAAMKIHVVALGTDAAKKFTLTAKVVLTR